LWKRSCNIVPYHANSEFRADAPSVPDLSDAGLDALSDGFLLTETLASSLGFSFFFSAGVACFFGEGFGVVFADAEGLGVGLTVGFGELFGIGRGVMLGFDVGVGTGVGDGSRISLWLAAGAGDSFSSGGGDATGEGCGVASCSAADDDELDGADSDAAAFIQIILGEFALCDSRLPRASAIRSTRCATVTIAALRQKRTSLGIGYFDSAFVAMPTFVICARCNASIKAINFCTGNSRSGRITTATSGFARFNSTNCAMS
jgi:hypothetical protein